MENILKNCIPSSLFRFFEEISKIPRESGNEKGIADYIEKFAKKRNLYCKRDKFNNVFVRKKASCRFENLPGILLQAHTDMVCQSVEGKEHDFLNEGIDILSDDRYIYADGTTLGADDGAGVALMLALLDDTGLETPETEYLFTSSEETGMYGAFGFDYSEIKSHHIINLDSEEEFNACMGCAGGIHVKAIIPIQRVKTAGKICSIEVSGLAGGHSGIDIDLGRSSAVKLIAFILDKLYKIFPFHIVEINGGGRDNVIPNYAKAIIAFVDSTEAKKAKEAMNGIKNDILTVLCKEDKKHFSVRFRTLGSTQEKEENAFSEQEFYKITCRGMLSLKSSSVCISVLSVTPQGVTDRYEKSCADSEITSVQRMDIAGSVNLGIVYSGEKTLELSYLIRSGIPFYSERILLQIERLLHLCGGEIEIKDRYPGWESKQGESIQKLYANAVSDLYGKKVIFSRVHAGLECGIIFEKMKEKGIVPEIISIGPNCEFIHTPRERMEILSFVRLYETVKYMICGKRKTEKNKNQR